MNRQRKKQQEFLLIWIDALCLVLSYIGGSFLGAVRTQSSFPLSSMVSSLWIVLLAYFLVFLAFNMNQYFMQRNKYEEFIYVLKLNLIMAVVLITVFFITRNTELITRSVWVFTVVIDTILMTLVHLILKRILRRIYKTKKSNHLLVVTSSRRIDSLPQELRSFGEYQDYVISLAVIDRNMVGQEIDGYRIVANGDNVLDVARAEVVDSVFLLLEDERQQEIPAYVEQFGQMGIVTHVNINLLEKIDGSFDKEVNRVGKFCAVSLAPRFFDYNKLMMKRLIDIAGACVGLVITAVVLVFVAPAVKLESPGPLIFKQKRVGKNGRYFYIYKIRSMYQDAEARKAELMEKNEMKGLMFKMTDDPRITKVGKFIRATSIDELPQFWNVLKGDMSLVGTRPPTVDEFLQYEGRHKRRLSMKPGLTGLWQVSGRSNIEDFEEVVSLDCRYIDNWSIQLDIQIILKTVVVIFKKVGSK